MISESALARLRRRAHVHTNTCYGRGPECVEHHVHDAGCFTKRFVCGQREDLDLVALLVEYDWFTRPTCGASGEAGEAD